MRIFLLGFMGTGKSHWGDLWAAAHNINFIDLDKKIEEAEGMPILDIFEKKGEDYCREAEARELRLLGDEENCIIACGGGAPCFYENIEWMNSKGHTVFLEANPQYILANTEKEKGKRPLLKNMNDAELLFFIEQKIRERTGFYRQAKTTLAAKDITEKSFEAILNTIKTNEDA